MKREIQILRNQRQILNWIEKINSRLEEIEKFTNTQTMPIKTIEPVKEWLQLLRSQVK